MAKTWGRGYRSGANKGIQENAILLWMKRGYFEVNSQLVEHRATISHENFWKKVRQMLPPAKALGSR